MVEPYRLLPPVGALHACLAAPHRGAAAVRHAEAAGHHDVGLVGRTLHLLAADVERSVAALTGSRALCALDKVAGTLAPRAGDAPGPPLRQRRGHEVGSARHNFGLLGACGLPITYAVAETWALLARPVGLDAAARRCSWAVGRTTLGLACGVVAGLALLPKIALVVCAALLGLAVGLGRLAVGSTRATENACFRPELPAVAAFDAQRRLERHLIDLPSERRSSVNVAAAAQALEGRLAAGDCTRTWRQADGARHLATAAEVTAALTQACAGPDGPAQACGARQASGPRQARWIEQVGFVLQPAALAHSLAGVELQVGARVVDAAELLQARPETSTCLVAHAGAHGRPAVRVDTVLAWSAGAVVPMANGIPVALPQALQLVWSVDVEAPASNLPGPAVAQLRQLVLGVGQAGAEAVRPLRVR